MKATNRIVAIFLAAIAVLMTIGCASTGQTDSTPAEVARLAEAVQPTISQIKSRGVLRIGTTGDYRPLSYREDTGEYWGFGIEVAHRIANELGVDIEFVPTSWPMLSGDVLSEPQAFDFALGGITITAKRLETMDMSEGYLANGKTILCRKEEAQKFRSLSDVDKSDVRVMVNPGGLNEKFACENLKNAKIIVHDRNEEIPILVAEGKADIMITEITEAPWYVQNDGRLSAPLLSEPFTHGEIGVLMRRGQNDLLAKVNNVIRAMKKDGSLQSLHEKYGLVYAYADDRQGTATVTVSEDCKSF